jgi:hypothetical protein
VVHICNYFDPPRVTGVRAVLAQLVKLGGREPAKRVRDGHLDAKGCNFAQICSNLLSFAQICSDLLKLGVRVEVRDALRRAG